MQNYNQYNETEKFFLECLNERLFRYAQYNHLPNCTCFSYCINELARNCKIYLETNKKINHLSLCEDFYEYMIDDIIFKLIDESQYYVLTNLLKDIKSNSANIKSAYTYITKTRSIYCMLYLNKTKEYLYELLRNDTKDYEKVEKITDVFINELLSQKLSYLFLVNIYRQFLHDNIFDSVYKLFEYLLNEDNSENIEMYLPLKDCKTRDIEFISVKQEIVQYEDIYYCKIYDNCVDYFDLCITNKRRIESILNFFKFYRNSNIDFDYSKKVKVIRKKIGDEFEVSFKDLLTYKYFVGKDSIINQTVHNLEILDNNNNILYYKINNILHYAEKDNDMLNASSYVDNWIALESIVKLSEVWSGYEGVKFYVPKMLAVKYLRQEINASLKNAFKNRTQVKLEEFIESCIKDNEYKICDGAKNTYYIYKLKKYATIISSFELLSKNVSAVQKRLERDIERIYLIRNEYVHSSNINAVNNMQKIKLKRILADTIDCFNKSLNGNVSNNFYSVSGEDIFSDLERKYLVEKTTLDLYNSKINYGSKIGPKNIVSPLEKHEVICNIIFERRTTLNKITFPEEIVDV